MNQRFFSLLQSLVIATSVFAQSNSPAPAVRVLFNERLGPLKMDQMALGQGGLSDEPMWADRIAEIRALRPQVIRLFIQEYFNLVLDAMAASADENSRLSPEPFFNLKQGNQRLVVELEPYGVHYWSFE